MKLYTEEQVRKAALLSLAEDATIEKILDLLTPIKIPSEEDVYNVLRGKKMLQKDWGFIEGTQWMRKKILNK